MNQLAAFALGLDYGTNSCRALVLDLQSGEPIADAVFSVVVGAFVDRQTVETVGQWGARLLGHVTSALRARVLRAHRADAIMIAFQSDRTFDFCLVVLADARFTESAGPAARTVGTSVFRANRGYALMSAVQSCTLVDCQANLVQSVAAIAIDTTRAMRASVGVADRIHALRGT